MESQVLIRCGIRGEAAESAARIPRVRLIEQQYFNLWRYMMEERHGLSVEDARLTLWIDGEDYVEREPVFSRAGEVEAVDRIVLNIYDPQNGLLNTIDRYALAGDTQQMCDILLTHVPERLRIADEFELRTRSGYCIAKNLVERSQVVMGLSTTTL